MCSGCGLMCVARWVDVQWLWVDVCGLVGGYVCGCAWQSGVVQGKAQGGGLRLGAFPKGSPEPKPTHSATTRSGVAWG